MSLKKKTPWNSLIGNEYIWSKLLICNNFHIIWNGEWKSMVSLQDQSVSIVHERPFPLFRSFFLVTREQRLIDLNIWSYQNRIAPLSIGNGGGGNKRERMNEEMASPIVNSRAKWVTFNNEAVDAALLLTVLVIRNDQWKALPELHYRGGLLAYYVLGNQGRVHTLRFQQAITLNAINKVERGGLVVEWQIINAHPHETKWKQHL